MAGKSLAFIEAMNDCIKKAAEFEIALRRAGEVSPLEVCHVRSAIEHLKLKMAAAESATLKYQLDEREKQADSQRRERPGRSGPAENDESGIYSMSSMTLSSNTLSCYTNSQALEHADDMGDKKNEGIQGSERSVPVSLISQTTDSTLQAHEERSVPVSLISQTTDSTISLLDKTVLAIDSTTNTTLSSKD